MMSPAVRRLTVLIPLFLALTSPAPASMVKLITPPGYLPGVPFPVRVEFWNAAGERDLALWNAEAKLTVDRPGIDLSVVGVSLRNGLGTALLTIAGSGDFTLRARVDGHEATRAVRDRSGETVTTVGGTLSRPTSTWRGVVNVVQPVVIPAGETLTIDPGTLVIVNGSASGTAGISFTVQGAVQSLGTEEEPVSITSNDEALNWGRILHESAQPSSYRHTLIAKAGRTPGEGHTGTGPAFRVNRSTVTFESCVISDLTAVGNTLGKVMMASGSDLVLRDCVMARARMGPEIAATGMLCTRSYFMEMRGPDDSDGIYLHESGSRPLLLSGCILAGGDDDAIDTLNANVTIENCIIRDWANPSEDAKGISVFHGEVTLQRCLIVDCLSGVAAKSSGPPATVRVDHCTVTAIDKGLSAAFKANATAGNLNFFVSNTIVRAPIPIHSDFGPERFVSVTYCNLSEVWPGTGNQTDDPKFVSAATGDYRLRPDSPCVDAGDPDYPPDADLSPTDIGFSTHHRVSTETAPPHLVGISPPSGPVTDLTVLTVTFSTAVTGVDAVDLRLGSVPASSVTGSGAGPYKFAFPSPRNGTVGASWALGHGIRDLAGNPFAGGMWTYLLDTNRAEVVISEIMYHPASENVLEEFIELHNRGASTVNLRGWRISQGVRFDFPDVSIPADGYLVVAADLATFRSKYPQVTNAVGGWLGTLSNSRETLGLDDARGTRVNTVRYADEGDWARRQPGLPDLGYRGWRWHAEHDGQGRSAELIDPALPNDTGQNWASSVTPEGTPGTRNSVHSDSVAPFILDVTHAPYIPKSHSPVSVTARIVSRGGRVPSVRLHYRPDRLSPQPFTEVPMRDDGKEGDAAARDGIHSATIPAQPDQTVVEFHLTARDSELERSWPAPAIPALDGAGPTGQAANALYQVDDSDAPGNEPLYKVILREAERIELQNIGNNAGGSANSDAQMNATFIGIDGTGTTVRYLVGVRNRGHGSRAAKPNNFRINFRSDDPWKGVLALNLNAQFSWLQVLGAALHVTSGGVGAQSRGVQFRVNNTNLVTTGANERTYGRYAANEAIDSDWARRHFPNDSGGNLYRTIRDRPPPEFDYRTIEAYPGLFGPENKDSYRNTYFKANNESEDDWTDLIAMLRVMGPNGPEAFTPENVGRMIDPEQWLRHLAVMNLLGNSETGLNTGHNDDYFLYRGVHDPRFVLMYYDLDQILGFNGSFGPTSSLFSAANNNGAGRAMGRLLRHSEFEPVYHETLRELLDTAFSPHEFDALVEHVLGGWVPAATRAQIRSYMENRRNFVRSQLPATRPERTPSAMLSAPPRSPTPRNNARFQVTGDGVAFYRYSINGQALSADIPVETPILLTNLPEGTNTLRVIGKNGAGMYQSTILATRVSWIVNSTWPPVRINEALAARSGGGRDLIELHNEGTTTVDLTGMRLSDNSGDPSKFTFGARSLAPGDYLVLDSGDLGFALAASGEGIYLYDPTSKGGDLLDRVEFGPQIQDYSIGRVGDNGEWALTQPTFPGPNVAQPLGDPKRVRINEWLAYGISPFTAEFIELFNPESLPAEIGGAFLTDHRVGDPRKSPIRPLSFLPAEGHAVFQPGNGGGGTELAFSLASEQGEITLRAPDWSIIDSVVYGPQRLGISMGRCPDGGAAIKALTSPSPGGRNFCPVEPSPPQVRTLLPFDQVWRYHAMGQDLGTGWRALTYDDSGWPSGPGLLGFEDAVLAEPLRTPFTNPRATTYYFRTMFEVDPALLPSTLEATHLIDDGAAFYLNGEQVGTRFNLPPAATAQTFASGTVDNANLQSFPIAADRLRPGMNVLAVEVHQVNATSSDMVFGLRLDALTYTNDAVGAAIALSEVLVRNASFARGQGRTPAWIELHNASASSVDVGGMSLTPDSRRPAAWVFPIGTAIPGGGFLVIDCDPSSPASAHNTGFGLPEQGGAIYLFDASRNGGGIRNALTYGLQVVDASLAFHPDRHWTLGIPTPGASNQFANLGDPGRLKINEWMANPSRGDDWFEIYNPEANPMSLEGLAVSDSLASPLRHRFPVHSFIAANAFLTLVADDQDASGADHVGFALNASGEMLAVARWDGTIVDAVSFGPQWENVSEGRLPDGGEGRAFFETPTPGASNGPDADRDKDGLPNDWESQFGLNPDDPTDAWLDPDGDGMSNFEEFIAGTHPRDVQSALRLAIAATNSGGFSIEFEAAADLAYELLVAPSLNGPWTRLDFIPAGPVLRGVRLQGSVDDGPRFFKVRLVAP